MSALRVCGLPSVKSWITFLCLFCLLTIGVTQDTATKEQPAAPKKAYDDVKNSTKLFSHIVKKEWDLALERLEEDPSEASILVERKDRTGAFRVRHLPLHQVFIGDLPKDVYGKRSEMSDEQLQVIKTLFRLNPRAVIQKDLKKRTLLHLAVASQVPPPDTVIRAFIKMNPHALKARDSNGRLPLHSAVVAPMTTFPNVDAIVSAYPEAVDLTDKDDALPLHLAAWGGGGPDAFPVIKLLVNSNPSSLSLKDGDEETVLTLMSKYGRTSEEAIDFVLEQDPKAILRDRDEKEGNTPLHYAASSVLGENSTIYAPILRSDSTAAEKINKLGKLPLHIALSQCCVSLQMVQDLVKAYPLGATLRDGDGYTPLHHACEAGVSNSEIIKLLLESSPKSVRQTASVKGRKGPLPFHLALRSESHRDTMDRVVSVLLKEYPDAARVKDPETKLASLPNALMAQRSAKVIRKLMLLDPDSVPTIFEAMEEGESVKTSAFHLLASIGPSYLIEDDMSAIVKDFLVMDPNGTKRRDGKGRTPLHIAWKDPLETDTMKRSRAVLSDAILDANPDVATILDDERRPALSYASVQRDSDAVNRILNAYPDAVKTKSKDGSYPLHYACGSGHVRNESVAIDAIVTSLLEAYPEAASEPNDEGELPLHRICGSTGQDHIQRSTIESVLEAYPKACEQRDSVGLLPLRIAVNNAVESDSLLDSEYWKGLIEVLLESYSAALSDKDKRGKTPFSSGVHIMDSLSHNRRRSDDPVLEVLEMLYDTYPASALDVDTGSKNVLHAIAQLFGDVGGMLTRRWTDFAIRIMHDYPELLSQTDKSKRTPLHLYILFLGDTAIGARDQQDPKTRRYTTEIEESLRAMIALYPEALDMREEYDLTPLDLINHKRLSYTRGSSVYKKSPIINAVRKILQRDEAYWDIARDLERAKIALGVAASKNDKDSRDACLEIQQTLGDVQKRIAARAQVSGITSNETQEDENACPDTENQPSHGCPNEVDLVQTLSTELERVASTEDTALEDE